MDNLHGEIATGDPCRSGDLVTHRYEPDRGEIVMVAVSIAQGWTLRLPEHRPAWAAFTRIIDIQNSQPHSAEVISKFIAEYDETARLREVFATSPLGRTIQGMDDDLVLSKCPTRDASNSVTSTPFSAKTARTLSLAGWSWYGVLRASR